MSRSDRELLRAALDALERWSRIDADDLVITEEIRARLAEPDISIILKTALDELLFAKKDSEQGAGWDHSRAQRVWREAAEAVRKYEASDAGSLRHEE